MSLSAVQICNRALDILGADPILSLADNTEAGRLCNRNYPAVRDAVIRAYPWNAAMRRAALPALAEAPAWGFAKASEMPTDCLRLWRVADEGFSDWRVEGRRVVSDIGPPLRILYLAALDDTTLVDPLMGEAIAGRLAADLAYRLAGSTSLASHAWTIYQSKLAEARRVDAQEGTAEGLVARDWLDARR
jgi:hypothetical protein